MSSIKGWCSYAIYPIYRRTKGNGKLIYYDGSGKHDSITMSGSRWFDHKNQVGGGAIKFMQEFYDMDFQTAVQELLGQTVTSLSHAPPKAVVHEEKTKEFKLPKSNENMHRVFAYLIKQRFINPEIISFFARNHTLYEDKEHHNAVFVGLDENGVPDRQASVQPILSGKLSALPARVQIPVTAFPTLASRKSCSCLRLPLI